MAQPFRNKKTKTLIKDLKLLETWELISFISLGVFILLCVYQYAQYGINSYTIATFLIILCLVLIILINKLSINKVKTELELRNYNLKRRE